MTTETKAMSTQAMGMWEEMREDMREHAKAMGDDPSCPSNLHDFKVWRTAREKEQRQAVGLVARDLLRRGYQVFVNAAPGEKPEIVFLDEQDEFQTVSVGRSLRELGVKDAAEVLS